MKKKIQNKKEFQQLLEQLQAKWESEREQFHSENVIPKTLHERIRELERKIERLERNN